MEPRMQMDWTHNEEYWRDNEEISSFIKAQESFGVKSAQDFEKNSKLSRFEQGGCHNLIRGFHSGPRLEVKTIC